ncbi:tryptophan-rich sensory protein [Liquorilactobacillus sucicola]|uniref:tryptophan-rich sensory protein n=1 Tax=Liquorilactobacillus sucicola TaxID=519050 RepID=UPI003084021D
MALLYLMIGISGLLLLQSSIEEKSTKFDAFIIYITQLFINFIWILFATYLTFSVALFNLN